MGRILRREKSNKLGIYTLKKHDWAILWYILLKGKATGYEISKELGLPESTAYKSLSILREGMLISYEEEKSTGPLPKKIYMITPLGLKELIFSYSGGPSKESENVFRLYPKLHSLLKSKLEKYGLDKHFKEFLDSPSSLLIFKFAVHIKEDWFPKFKEYFWFVEELLKFSIFPSPKYDEFASDVSDDFFPIETHFHLENSLYDFFFLAYISMRVGKPWKGVSLEDFIYSQMRRLFLYIDDPLERLRRVLLHTQSEDIIKESLESAKVFLMKVKNSSEFNDELTEIIKKAVEKLYNTLKKRMRELEEIMDFITNL